MFNGYHVPGVGLGKNILPPRAPQICSSPECRTDGFHAASRASPPPATGHRAWLATPSGQ